MGVTIAVFYKTQSGVRYTVTYTQVEQANPIDPLLTSEAKSSTVRVSSAMADGTNLLEQLGVINLSGELFSGSRVVTTASAATAGILAGRADHRCIGEPGRTCGRVPPRRRRREHRVSHVGL